MVLSSETFFSFFLFIFFLFFIFRGYEGVVKGEKEIEK
nr:MAG TPA: hypothetical protein [Caudoviricetes sp.]